LRKDIEQDLRQAQINEEPLQAIGECLQSGICAHQGVSTLDISPPIQFSAIGCERATLDSFYSQRGIGKTWLALEWRMVIAEKKNVGPLGPIHQPIKNVSTSMAKCHLGT